MFHRALIFIVKILFLCSIHQNYYITVVFAANPFSFRGHSPEMTIQNNHTFTSSSLSSSFNQASDYHYHSKISTLAVNTASTFTANTQISTAQNSAVSWQLYYLDRLSIECTGLGLNTFALVTSGSNWYYNYICVTPGFTSTTTSYSNIVAVQGGQVPVYNIKFFQYVTPYMADCR